MLAIRAHALTRTGPELARGRPGSPDVLHLPDFPLTRPSAFPIFCLYHVRALDGVDFRIADVMQNQALQIRIGCINAKAAIKLEIHDPILLIFNRG